MIDEIKELEKNIKEYVINTAKAKGVVIGMSGGKDSLICAKLCANAIGKENVLGLIMPNNSQKDVDIAIKSCKIIGIDYQIIDISDIYNDIIHSAKTVLDHKNITLNSITTINTQPRIRTNLLYAVGGSMNYLVVNTSNLSETMIGYTTKWGDNVGDFSPIANYTKTEVCQIGMELGLPKELVQKTPEDALSGKSDEENIGFSYDELDNYIRNGIKDTNFKKIENMHKYSNHKRLGVIKFKNNRTNYFDK